MADWKSGGKDKKPNWRGNAPVPGRAQRHGWKAAAEKPPGFGKRRLGAIAVGTILLGVTVAIIWWVLLPKNPPKPCLVLLAANPADHCLKLDIPMDLYGWLGGKLLAQQSRERLSKEQAGVWGTYAPEVAAGADGSPLALPSNDEQLADWANSLKNFDPVVIYVGAHAGTGPEGPFFYSGGRTRLPVKKFLDTLASPVLRDKKKIVLLDPGRLPPQAIHGQLIDDFTLKFKQFNADIAACPNLLVVVGCEGGERAWESEEMQATPLAIAVAEAFNGAVEASGNDDLISGREFFEFVKKRVTEWTRENRPTTSTPFLLPEGEAGLTRAETITVAVRPSTPAPIKSPVTAIDFEALEKLWTRHDRLGQSSPSPEAYNPRQWRRFRDLMLRCESAMRAGDATTVSKLQAGLDAAEETLKGRSLPAFESAVNSTALQQARGLAPADRSIIPQDWLGNNPISPPPTDPAIRLAIMLDVLRNLSTDKGANPRSTALAGILQRLYDPDLRPIEAHLPVMVQEFFASPALGSGSPVPTNASLCFSLRQLSEQCGFGLRDKPNATNPNTNAHCESAWLSHAKAIHKVDLVRRSIDDQLFSIIQIDSTAITRQIDELSLVLQNAIQLRYEFSRRDHCFADWPFLSNWLIESNANPNLLSELPLAWRECHDWVKAIEDEKNTTDVKGENRSTESAMRFSKTFASLMEQFQNTIAAQEQIAAVQGQWMPKQWLLSVPIIPAPQRVRLIRASRDISARLLGAGGKQTGGLLGGEAAADPKARVVNCGRIALEMLGKELCNSQCAKNTNLMRFEIMESDLQKMATAGNPEPANAIGRMIADHYAELAKPLPPVGTVNAVAERFSRVAVAFDPDDGLEPANVNQRLRWNAVLTTLGERYCLDRWYDEKERPYFRIAAERCFRDADAIVTGLPASPRSATETKRREELLADRRLRVTASPERLNWTSELSRQVRFEVTTPPEFPAIGQATAIRNNAKASPLKSVEAESDRIPLAIKAGPAIGFASALALGNAEMVQASCSAGATVYFRGQRPTVELPIAINRRPDLVLADPLPKPADKGVSLAVRAAADLDFGEIVVIVDYSGSMRFGLNNEDYTKNFEYRSKPSKFRYSMDSLRDVLQDLPFETRLKIRVFSDRSSPDSSRLVFGEGGGVSRTTWQRGNLKPLDDLMKLLESFEPSGFTPLVSSIIAAADQDFSKESARTKTVVVLSDGIDQQNNVPNDLARMERLSGDLITKFRDSDITLLVVQFALDREELKLSQELFKSLKSHRNPGRVWTATDKDRLREDLRDALRPKLKLSDSNGTPAGYPRSGWPARVRGDGKDDRESLYWSPLLTVPANQRFLAIPYPSAERIDRELRTEDGDRLLLEIAKSEGRTVVRRDLYADFFPEAKKKQRADNQWVLTAPTTTVDDSRDPLSLHGLVFLEKTPPHRLGATDPSTVLQTVRPEYLWWDIAPTLESAKPVLGTVIVRKLHGYAAPAWDIRAENWPRDPASAGQFAVPRITALVSDRPPPSKTIEMRISDQVSKATTADGDEVELWASLEPHKIGPAGQEISCLIVRAVHMAGRPVMLRLASPILKHNVEHRYYLKADSYTAIFGPLVESDFRSQPAKLELISATALRTDPAAAISLSPPRPTPGVRLEQEYKPQPGRPVEDR